MPGVLPASPEELKENSEMIKKLLRAIGPLIAAESRRIFSDTLEEQALNLIYSRGYQAHCYKPGIARCDDTELWEALETLGKAGYVISDENGTLVGGFSDARLSPEEQADFRRARFKLIETKK